jgi:hypothetical protein
LGEHLAPVPTGKLLYGFYAVSAGSSGPVTITASLSSNPTNVMSVCYAIASATTSGVTAAYASGSGEQVALTTPMSVSGPSAVVGISLLYSTNPTAYTPASPFVTSFVDINNGYQNFISSQYGVVSASTSCSVSITPSDSWAELCVMFP